MCVDAFTQPGDGIVLMTPVYAFARVIKAAGRTVVACDLAVQEGRYIPDFAAWDARMTGAERMMILCSPHNPGGRVWTAAELRGIADFCKRHDLILVSDEIHPRSGLSRRAPHPHRPGRTRHRRPAGDDDRHDQDLQHRGRTFRQRHHRR